jgi:hypothetical protein
MVRNGIMQLTGVNSDVANALYSLVAERFGLSPRQVKRILERAREARHATFSTRGARKMRDGAATIADINAGAVGPDDARRLGASKHLARCPRCRGSLSVDSGPPQ